MMTKRQLFPSSLLENKSEVVSQRLISMGTELKKLMFEMETCFVCLIRNENGTWSQSFEPFILHLHIELNQQKTSFLGWNKHTIIMIILSPSSTYFLFFFSNPIRFGFFSLFTRTLPYAILSFSLKCFTTFNFLLIHFLW